MSTGIYHIHHIIPRHMGGSDDPSNLIKLTVEEHALAHKKLWEEHGKEEDRIAWLALSNIMKKEEVVESVLVLSGKNTQRLHNKDGRISSMGGKALWSKPGMREHLSQKRKEQINPMLGKSQKRVCCLCCKRDLPINVFAIHVKRGF